MCDTQYANIQNSRQTCKSTKKSKEDRCIRVVSGNTSLVSHIICTGDGVDRFHSSRTPYTVYVVIYLSQTSSIYFTILRYAFGILIRNNNTYTDYAELKNIKIIKRFKNSYNKNNYGAIRNESFKRNLYNDNIIVRMCYVHKILVMMLKIGDSLYSQIMIHTLQQHLVSD